MQNHVACNSAIYSNYLIFTRAELNISFSQASMMNNSINQSASFKRVMYSVMNDEFANE